MVAKYISGIFARMRPSKAGASRFERSLCVSALACFSFGCSNGAKSHETEPAPKVWIGEVQDTDVKVALADRKESVALFFCGGDASYTTSTRWFAEGALLNAPFSFTSSGWSVDGDVAGTVAQGSVQIDASTGRAWTAESANSETIAGLYEGSAPCGKLGLIVTQRRPEDAPTGQGACVQVEGDAVLVEQVNPVRLEPQGVAREISVTVASLPDEEFTVRPVAGVPE